MICGGAFSPLFLSSRFSKDKRQEFWLVNISPIVLTYPATQLRITLEKQLLRAWVPQHGVKNWDSFQFSDVNTDPLGAPWKKSFRTLSSTPMYSTPMTKVEGGGQCVGSRKINKQHRQQAISDYNLFCHHHHTWTIWQLH